MATKAKLAVKRKTKALIGVDNEYEDWANRKWRPYTAWTYLVICIFDFILAPVMTFYFFGGTGHASYLQWQPITLVGSGLFHIAMGAIIGVTAWQRGEERKYQVPDTYHNYQPRNNRQSRTSEPVEHYDQAEYRDNLARNASREN